MQKAGMYKIKEDIEKWNLECVNLEQLKNIFQSPYYLYQMFKKHCHNSIVYINKWKSWLKTQHSKNKDHGTQSYHLKWQISGEKMETVIDFIFFGSKTTVDGDCSNKIKRCLLLGRKAMTNLGSVLKSRYHFADKTVVKAMGFAAVVYVCECWTIKKVEHERIDALELWCWRRLLRVPWIAKRSN